MIDSQSKSALPLDADQCDTSSHKCGQTDDQGQGRAGLPICSLAASRVDEVREHILSLNERDRYMRFGFQATNEQINGYVGRIDFEHDEVFGV